MAISNRRRGGTNFGLILLASQVLQIGTNNIPPVTLATVILNVVIYLGVVPIFPTVHGACTSNSLVFHQKQWKRLLYSSFYHLDDMHLYFNMASFIWKGIKLERQMKSRKFLFLISLFAVLSQVVMLGINQVLSEIFTSDYYIYTCAAGFSAVCFALKVVTTVNTNGNESIMGLPFMVPAKYACWVELVLIQILVPNASFTGHLAGILVGLLYTHGPLERLINLIDGIFSGFQDQPRRSYTHERGQAAGNNERSSKSDDDDELQRAIRESLRTARPQPSRSQPPPSYGWRIPESTNDSGTSDSRYSNIYPDLSQNQTPYPPEPYTPSHRDYTPSEPSPFKDNTPSAPPYMENSSTPPYPTDNFQGSFSTQTPPYPVYDDINYSSQSPTDDQDNLRRARLRRFEKKT